MNPLSIKTIKGWGSLWYGNIRGSVNPLINGARFLFFLKGVGKGQRGNKQQPLVTFTKTHKYTGEWDVPVFHLTVGLKLKNKKKTVFFVQCFLTEQKSSHYV